MFRTAQLTVLERGAVQEVFVDQAIGNDSNEGTRSSPFATITAALASITDASAIKPYAVLLATGVYDEKVVMKPYVDVRGVTMHSTRLENAVDDTLVFPDLGGGRSALYDVKVVCTSPNPIHSAVHHLSGSPGDEGRVLFSEVENNGAGLAVDIEANALGAYVQGSAIAVALGGIRANGFLYADQYYISGDGVAPDLEITATGALISAGTIRLGNGLLTSAAMFEQLQGYPRFTGVNGINPANWVATPPANMLEALDRIAAHVGPVGVELDLKEEAR